MRKRSIKNLQTLKPWNLHSKGERHLSAFSATLPQESHANGTASEDYFAMIQATLILQKENRHRKSEEQESTELLFWNLNHLWNEKTLRQIKQKWQTWLYSNLRQEAIDFLDASVENRPSWEAATVFTLKRLAFLEWACSLEGSLKIQRTLVLGDGRTNCVFWTEMYLKYFEVIMLVSLFLEECLTSDQSQRSDEIQVICFFSLWASPRQEYGNIKKTTTYRYFDKFFRCRAICSQNWRGISLTHESWERSGPRRSLKSSMPMYKRRWMIGSLVWHVWWHQAIQMGRCLCSLLRTQRGLASSPHSSNMPGGFRK